MPDVGGACALRRHESAARFSWDASMRRASLAHDHFASGRVSSSRQMSLAFFVSPTRIHPPSAQNPKARTSTRSTSSSKRKFQGEKEEEKKIFSLAFSDFENEIGIKLWLILSNVISILVNFEKSQGELDERSTTSCYLNTRIKFHQEWKRNKKESGWRNTYIYIYIRRNVFENNDFKEDWLVNERV